MAPSDRRPRYLAFDEGPFTFADEEVAVAGVLTRGATQVEALRIGQVTVDGWDATATVVSLTQDLPGHGPDVVLIDGITLGGLNLVDLDEASRLLDRPVLGVTRRRPERAAMERAVAQAPDPERRQAALPPRPPVAVAVEGRMIHVQVPGRLADAWTPGTLGPLLAPAFADAGIPEPLRLAHHVATAHVTGRSGTKA